MWAHCSVCRCSFTTLLKQFASWDIGLLFFLDSDCCQVLGNWIFLQWKNNVRFFSHNVTKITVFFNELYGLFLNVERILGMLSELQCYQDAVVNRPISLNYVRACPCIWRYNHVLPIPLTAMIFEFVYTLSTFLQYCLLTSAYTCWNCLRLITMM